MAYFYTSTDSTTKITAKSTNDTWVVKQGVSVIVAGDPAIDANSADTGRNFEIYGYVRSSGYGMWVGSSNTSGGSSDIYIGSQGQLRSESTTLVVYGGDSYVENQGMIIGSNRATYFGGGTDQFFNSGIVRANTEAIMLDGTTLYLENSGSIVSRGGAAINAFFGTLRLHNTGQIQSMYGEAVAAYNAIIFNSGEITASSANYYNMSVRGSGSLYNTGILNGRVEFSGSFYNSGTVNGNVNVYNSDFVVSGGHINGNITSGGSADQFTITGGTVNGTVNLGGGNDTITLSGGTIRGTNGITAVTGGLGNDTYILTQSGFRLSEAANGGTDTVHSSISYRLATNIENLTLMGTDDLVGIGNAAKNTLIGNDGDNILRGLDGNDLFMADEGADRMDGGLGVDTVKYTKSESGVTVDLAAGTGSRGLAEGDTLISIEYLTGSLYSDRLIGNSGNNRLEGLAGTDLLTGGLGNDVFAFAKGWGMDTITDFEQGKDKISILGFGTAVDSFSDLAVTQHSADVWIDFGSGAAGDRLILKGETVADFTAADFTFG